MKIESMVNVLLVEDSPTDVLLTQGVVDDYPEFRLQHVDRLSKAIHAMVDGAFDVVLLDLGLPDSQGLDTLINLLQARPDVPVVVMTARDDEDMALEAVQAGAQDYLVKHRVVNGMLCRTIRYAIERRHAEQARRERAALAMLSADVGSALVSGVVLSEMAQYCVESMIRNLNGALARIWTLSHNRNTLELLASAGLQFNLDAVSHQTSWGQFHIQRIAKERQPYSTNELTSDPQNPVSRWAQSEGIQAFAGYPLILDDQVVGVLGLFARKTLTETTLQALATTANQIALGIGNKAQELVLKGSQERFRELTAHIGQVLWMMDALESKILYVSPGYETMWGRSCQTLLEHPQSFMEGIHPDDLEMMQRENLAMFQSGQIDVECRVLRPDATVRWIWIRGYPVLNQGHLVRIVGVIEDITEKRNLAAERDTLLSRLQLHIARMPLAYVLLDSDFRIIDWNPAAERIFGYSREEMLGVAPPFENIVPGSSWELGERTRKRLLAGDMNAHITDQNLTKDGRTITCDWFNTPLMNDQGTFAGLLCLAQDVTERKSLEAQFHQAQKMDAIGQLAGGVAHDFNNLLTIILGYSELLRDSLDTDDARRISVEAISDAGDRAAMLTRQLLAFSRKSVLEPKVLDLNEVVRDTERFLRRLIGEDILLTAVLDPKISHVKVDPGQLGQVLMNLVVNSRDAMPKGGQLTLETRHVVLDQEYTRSHSEVQPGRYVMLSITDTGTGMSPDVKRRIFEPFFTTKASGKGTGLGLSVVLGVVKQSGGHVEVYTEPGIGTTFKLYLPVVDENQSDPQNTEHLKTPRGTETVLLVEDEISVSRLAELILKTNGYRVMTASNGEEARCLVEEYQGLIDILVTDVVMPFMNGPDLAEALLPRFPLMKVLFCSGYADDAVFRHGLLHEKVELLRKPYSPLTLAAKVRQVLDAK